MFKVTAKLYKKNIKIKLKSLVFDKYYPTSKFVGVIYLWHYSKHSCTVYLKLLIISFIRIGFNIGLWATKTNTLF